MSKPFVLSILPVLAAASLAAAPTPVGERFAFVHAKGDRFRVVSEVQEDVYINRRFSHSAEILNRITFEVADAAPDGSWGLLEGRFETSERPAGEAAYLVSESYDSIFRRDRLGRYSIEDKYYMPVVRNVPAFPDRELAPGDEWTAPGEERHDFRRGFGIPDPYAIPFEARYRYEGSVARHGDAGNGNPGGGEDLRLVSASYTIFHRPPPPRAYAEVFPIQIAGFSDLKILWDPSLGQPVSYEERFDFVFDWSDGSTIEYRGTSRSGQFEAERMDRPAMKAEIEAAIAGMPDVTVAETEEGVTISLEDLQFEADSAALRASELAKLTRIAQILARYPGRDILVAGHAAQAGWAEGRKKLSEDRARAVAGRLIELGAREPDRVRAVGYADERPIADNATEAGRARNRRVEITILEN
jgi:outer membrane protein OmpA-like peptidoglycan-associated protein